MNGFGIRRPGAQPRMPGGGSERGIALITVIVVLMALVIIATPFSISMRNHSESATDLLHRTRALKECEALRNIALERLKDTHPTLDITSPLFDTAAEWDVLLEDLGLDFKTSDPRGKIWSLKIHDLQGRINLNTASIYLLANLLDRRTHLTGDMEEGDTSLKVLATDAFPRAGVLWLEGEGIFYGDKTSSTFDELDRALELPSMEWNRRNLLHQSGAEVIGFAAYLSATYCYKWNPGKLSFYPTKESLRNISVYGEESITRDELDRIADLVTVHSGSPGGRRFVNPQRVLHFGEEDTSDALQVENGRYIGPGSIVRVRSGDQVHHSMVLRSQPSEDRSWTVILQEPVPFEADGSETGLIEVLARHPVNINTAPLEVLTALLEGLELSREGAAWIAALAEGTGGGQEASGAGTGSGYLSSLGLGGGARRIGPADARAIAAAIRQGPIQTFAELDERLITLTESEEQPLSDHQRWAVMLNALNSNDAYLRGGTAPFCFASEGCFRIDTAVSDNYEASGREMARQFTRDAAWPAPEGPLLTAFSSQLDFEEQRRLTREGRHYITLPVNLNQPDKENLPPSMAPMILFSGRSPSEAVEGSGFQLAPVRTEGARTFHFDESDRPCFTAGAATLLPPGGEDAVQAFDDALGFMTGERVLFLDPLAEPAKVLGGPYARVWPFSVEFWYRFDELRDEHYIFDLGLEGRVENNRIYLYFDGKDLVLRASDATLPTSSQNSDQPLEHAEIRYDFSDLPLEKGVFYHFACMVAGTRPSDLCLFVDGFSRGKRAFQTRLTEPLATAANLNAGEGLRGSRAAIKVEDTSTFPDRGVLRIGWEILEYSGKTDKEFIADPLDTEPFGGRAVRGSFPTDHEETEIVELFGYACPLHSELIPTGEVQLGDNLGPFWVAMVDPEGNDMDTDQITVGPRTGDAQYGTATIGTGFFGDTSVQSLPLLNLDKTKLDEEGESAFSKGGGYAVVFSEFPYGFTLRFQNQNQQLTETYTVGPGDGGRAMTASPKEDYFVNGFSVIHYDSFNGSSLQGVDWPSVSEQGYPKGRPETLMKNAHDGEGQDGQTGQEAGRGGSGTNDFLANRCFVTEYTAGFFKGDTGGQPGSGGNEDQKDIREARVFVFPISVKVGAGAGDLFEDFHSTPNNPGEVKPEIVQIGLDFNESGDDETEWVRYDSIEEDLFIREDPAEIQRCWNYLADPERIDWNQAIENDDAARVVNREIRFRAQHGTPNNSHSSGSLVLPVFRVSISKIARPGRHDAVTLVADDPDAEPEAGMINYCNSRGSPGEGGPYQDRDWGPVALIGLRSGVVGEYLRQDFDFGQVRQDIQQALKTGTGIGDALATAWAIESRDVTRILKFPSGELPNKIPDVFALGGMITGEPSPAQGCIDEVRFKSFQTPNLEKPELPKICRFLLEEELDEDEGSLIQIYTDALRYNRQVFRHDLLKAFEILKSLPQDAGLLLIGDELIGYTDVDWEEGIITIAPEGRGMFGTKPGYHAIEEPVHLLNFAELSILENSITDDDAYISLKDPEGFPFEGAVLIDQEVIGYTRLEEDILTMPEVVLSAFRSSGLLRGRYGTAPDKHPAGSVVYCLPIRYRDLYMPGADEPEAAYFPLGMAAPGAFYSRLSWKEDLQGPGADLVVLARVGGRGDWVTPPSESPDLFLFEDPGTAKRENILLRQGDRLDLRVFTRYGAGAFDALDFASNAWKYAPVMRFMGIEYVQPTRIVRHEEWR